MRHLLIFLAFILFAALLGLAAPPAQAATPTPSPTLKPLTPSPTSNTLNLYATPTPLPILTAQYTLNLGAADPQQTAYQLINMYRYWNHDHIIDLILTVGLAGFAVVLIVRFIGRSTRTNN